MLVSILFIIGVYIVFRLVDEGVGMFDSLRLTIRRMIQKRRPIQAEQSDYQWKGIAIGFAIGTIFMLIVRYYW